MIEDKEKLQIWHNILFIKGFEVLGLGFNLSQLIFSGDSTFERKLLEWGMLFVVQTFRFLNVLRSKYLFLLFLLFVNIVVLYMCIFLLEKNYTLSVYLYYHTFSSVHMKQFVRIVFSRILLDEGHFNRQHPGCNLLFLYQFSRQKKR